VFDILEEEKEEGQAEGGEAAAPLLVETGIFFLKMKFCYLMGVFEK